MTRSGTFGGMTWRGCSNCSYTSYGDMTRDTIDAEEVNHPGSLYTIASTVTWAGSEHTFRTAK